MAANHVYTQPVTDYFTSIPMKYEQKILETIHWSVIDCLPKEEVLPQMPIAGYPSHA
jgi:hypothetical protein